MEKGKVVSNKEKPSIGLALMSEEKKRLVDFFSILVEIDQRNKKNETDTD